MTKKVRTIFFFIFLFLFCLITPAAIFYFQGYRFDFENKKLTQTGGFYIQAIPNSVEIYINEKLTKKTSFFLGFALIENLLPKKYKIRVEKEGFYPWEKELEIEKNKVTEAKYIILFPKNIKFNTITKNIENLWFSPDGKKIILLEKEDKSWSLKLYDTEKRIKSHLISATDISSKDVNLIKIEFSDNQNEIYLDVGTEEKEQYFILGLEKFPPKLMEREIIPPVENTIISQKINNDYYYLDSEGYLFKNELKINEKPFPVQNETEYKLVVFQDFIFLKEEGVIYLFNPELKSFEKLFERVNNFKISPDNKKIVFSSDFEIWLFFLGENKEKIFLSRFAEKIGDIYWLNPDYLIFNAGNKIKITEIDKRDKLNIIDIAEFNAPKIFWNQNERKIYLFSEGNLFFSEKFY